MNIATSVPGHNIPVLAYGYIHLRGSDDVAIACKVNYHEIARLTFYCRQALHQFAHLGDINLISLAFQVDELFVIRHVERCQFVIITQQIFKVCVLRHIERSKFVLMAIQI